MFIENVFISLTYLKCCLSGYRIVSDTFFSFRTFNILFQYLLAFIVFGEKSAINLLLLFTHKMAFFSGCFQVFLFSFFQFNCDFSRSDFIFIYLFGALLSFLNLSFLPNLGRCSNFYALFFIWDSSYMYLAWGASYCLVGLWNFVHFYSNISLFFGWIISVDLYSSLSAISKLSLSLFRFQLLYFWPV